jgi:hypothetical protein
VLLSSITGPTNHGVGRRTHKVEFEEGTIPTSEVHLGHHEEIQVGTNRTRTAIPLVVQCSCVDYPGNTILCKREEGLEGFSGFGLEDEKARDDL